VDKLEGQISALFFYIPENSIMLILNKEEGITIKLPDLAQILEINNMKEIYTIPHERFFQPVFQCCDKDEAVSFQGNENGLYPKKGIYIPNVGIDRLYEEGEAIGFTEYVKEFLNEQNITYFNEVVYACFCLYHEEGHFYDYKTSGLTAKEFMERDRKDKEQLSLYEYHIKTTPEEERQIQISYYYFLYNQMRAEVFANEYATNRVVENIGFIRSLNN
jgi:hypothetical protein